MTACDQTLAFFTSLAFEELFPSYSVEERGLTQHGFYLSFQGSFLHQESITALEKKVSDLLAEAKDLKPLEMLAENAKEFLLHKKQKVFLDKLAACDPKELVSLIKIKETYHLFEGEFKIKDLIVGHFFLFLPEEKDSRGSFRLFGASASSSKNLQTRKEYYPFFRKDPFFSLLKSRGLAELTGNVGCDWDIYWKRRGFLWLEAIKKKIQDLAMLQGWEWVKLPEVFAPEKENFWNYPSSFQMKCPLMKKILHAFAPCTRKEAVQKRFFWQASPLRSGNSSLYSPQQQSQALAFALTSEERCQELVKSSLQFIEEIIKILGFSRKYCLSVPQKRAKAPFWEKASEILRESLDSLPISSRASSSLPQIEISLVDRQGREWQGPNLRLLPLESSKKEDAPFVLLSINLLGALERVMALILEDTRGDFPLWMAPEHIWIFPVSEKQLEYARRVSCTLWEQGIRNHVDPPFRRLQERIVAAEKQRVPYVALVGEKEEAKQCLAVRKGRGKKTSFPSVEMLAKQLSDEIKRAKNSQEHRKEF